jgi:hypothetical protein
MTTEYDTVAELTEAIRTLDAHGIGWAATSQTTPNPFGPDPITSYRLYVSEVVSRG